MKIHSWLLWINSGPGSRCCSNTCYDIALRLVAGCKCILRHVIKFYDKGNIFCLEIRKACLDAQSPLISNDPINILYIFRESAKRYRQQYISCFWSKIVIKGNAVWSPNSRSFITICSHHVSAVCICVYSDDVSFKMLQQLYANETDDK